MKKPEIITNNVPRHILYAHELTKEEWNSLGLDEDEQGRAEQEGDSFLKYKGNIYPINDFMRTDHHSPNSSFGSFWHGYSSDTYFSGTLIHICEDGDSVIMGRYYS